MNNGLALALLKAGLVTEEAFRRIDHQKKQTHEVRLNSLHSFLGAQAAAVALSSIRSFSAFIVRH